MQSAEQRPMREELAHPPVEDEVMGAMGKLSREQGWRENWHLAGNI